MSKRIHNDTSNIETKPEIFSNTLNHSELLSHQNQFQKGPSDIINNSPSLMMSLSSKNQPINLEDLVIQEDKLWNILDNIRTNCNFNFSAEEYLEFSQITSIQDISVFFRDKKLRSFANIAGIYEYISVMLCSFVYLKNFLSQQSVDHLKNMLYYSHQNLLLITNQILNRVNKEYKNNIWVIKLREIIKNKKSTFIKGDDSFIIEHNCNILYNALGNFLLIYFNNENEARIFAILNDILIHINTCLIDNVKNNLTNLKNMIIHCNENSQNSVMHINIPGPFLPKMNSKYKYTLVLDLDETIIHCPDQQEIQPLIRPGTEKFLSELSQYYEIVIFTAAMQDYADFILDQIDKEKKWISHRLYRQHTTVLKRSYLKDIAKLGRDLTKTIIIDNASDNFQLQTDNGIFITTWIDDENDTALYDLIPVLKEIAVKKVNDVRKALRKIRDTMIRFYVKGDSNPYNTVLSFIKGERKTTE